MSPFEDFDLDLLKIQNVGGIDPLDSSDWGDPSGIPLPTPSFPPSIPNWTKTCIFCG